MCRYFCLALANALRTARCPMCRSLPIKGARATIFNNFKIKNVPRSQENELRTKSCLSTKNNVQWAIIYGMWNMQNPNTVLILINLRYPVRNRNLRAWQRQRAIYCHFFGRNKSKKKKNTCLIVHLTFI